MTNWRHLNRLPVYIGIAAALSACGSSSTTFQNSAGGSSSSSGSSSGSSSSTTTTSATSTTTAAADALSFANIAVTGAGGSYPTYSTYSTTGAYITTDNVLKVRVTVEPGTSGLAISTYSGFSANYNCVSYQVSIYDDSGTLIGSQETGMLQVSGTSECIGSSGSNYQDLDFSGSVINPHGGIDVRLQALSYDWYCQLWYDYLDEGNYTYYSDYNYFCPSKAVYRLHTVDASIEVQTNGTQFF